MLTPFYPSAKDDANGCFVAEPIAALDEKILCTVLAVEPIYRQPSKASSSGPAAQWVRYFSIPSTLGLATAGVFLYARIVGLIRALHAHHRIDLIHAHAPLACGHAAMLLRAELGIPYVVTVHGLDAFSTLQVKGTAGEWCRRISKRIYGNARRVICISEKVRDRVLEGMGGSCRTAVIYNGADTEMFRPGPEQPEEPVILSVGNLIPIKGHEMLLRAVGALRSEFPKLTCEIIGDGPERARLQALARELKIADRVHFLGRRSRAQVAEAMRRCILFALPSRYEGLGCVYLEAMSCAKPVIACRGQGIAEVIRDGCNGVLVGADNEKELGQAMARLLRDEKARKKMGETARHTVLRSFTLADQATHLAHAYRECVE
jgi:teichuronic acid biosynthesis glycosyltransferase TuaC